MQAKATRTFNRLARSMAKQGRVLVQIVADASGNIDAGDGLYWGMAQLKEGRTLCRVRAKRVKPYPDAWYKAEVSPDDGVLEIVDVDPVTTPGFFGGLDDPGGALSVPNHGWTHQDIDALDPVWVELQQILGAQVRPTYPRTLSVDVTPYLPLNFAGDTLDLTSYLPTGGMTCFVIISLDDITRTLVVTVSDDVVAEGGGYPFQGGGPVPFDADDVDALAVNHNYVRLAAVRLYVGQSEITWKDIFLDLRDFLGRRDGYLRLDDDDPTIDGLADKLVAGLGLALSRVEGDYLLLSVPGATGSGWNSDGEPEIPSAYDDEFNDASFDAVLWTEYDTGTIETIVEASDKLSLSQASQTDPVLTGVYQAIPGGDFTIAVKVQADYNTGGAGFHFGAGLVLWEDATGDDNGALFAGLKVIENTWRGFGTSYFTANDVLDTDSPPSLNWTASTWYYLRLRRDGTAYYFDFSDDGVTWTVKDITGKVVFTPTHFGLGMYNQDTGVTLQADFDFFRYRLVADSVGDPVYGRPDGSNVILPSGLSSMLPISPLTGSPYFETDTHVLRVGYDGGYVSVAGAPGLVPNPVAETTLVPAGYQATWIVPPGGTVGITGALHVEGMAIFLGGL